MMDRFLAFSSAATGFSVFELRGTGQAEAYLAAIEQVVGSVRLGVVLDAYDRTAVAKDRNAALRRDVLGDEMLGPIARNIIKMWYIGVWYELPHEWTETFGAIDQNTTFMVSAAAYTEGLLWPAVGAHPPGAKPPGYGSWVDAPQFQPARV